MYIAMNRFKINQGFESAFEDIWRKRDSYLKEVPGFCEFHLLKGSYDEWENITLYASHTIWETKDDFVAWTKSEHFRKAHRNAGSREDLYAGHPNFEGFEAIIEEYSRPK